MVKAYEDVAEAEAGEFIGLSMSCPASDSLQLDEKWD